MNDKVEGTGGRTIPLTPYLASLLLTPSATERDPSQQALTPPVFCKEESEVGAVRVGVRQQDRVGWEDC